MNATIIHQPPLHLITTKPKNFPEGVSAAFDLLESHLETLKGRRFYGLAYESGGDVDYYAGLVPDNEIEECRFTEIGFAIKNVEGGPCARVRLRDWESKTDQIGPTFASMINEFGIDPSRPQMEFYHSLAELHLLLPVPS